MIDILITTYWHLGFGAQRKGAETYYNVSCAWIAMSQSEWRIKRLSSHGLRGHSCKSNVLTQRDMYPEAVDRIDMARRHKRSIAPSVEVEKERLWYCRNGQMNDFHGTPGDSDDQCAHHEVVVGAEKRLPGRGWGVLYYQSCCSGRGSGLTRIQYVIFLNCALVVAWKAHAAKCASIVR